MTIQQLAALAENGWDVENNDPFTIKHKETGSIATMLAAEIVAEHLVPHAPLPFESGTFNCLNCGVNVDYVGTTDMTGLTMLCEICLEDYEAESA